MRYFDENRNKNPITDIVSVAALTADEMEQDGCDAGRKAEDGWERVTELTSWRGVMDGCL